MKTLITFSIALLLLLFTSVANSETFYVCNGGDGSAPTTDACATAWDRTHFNNAANWGAGAGKISPGDVVLLKDDGGAFDGQWLPKGPGGDPGNPVIIQNYPGDAVITQRTELDVWSWAPLSNPPAKYITLRKNPAGGSFTCKMNGNYQNLTGPKQCIIVHSSGGFNHDGVTIDGLVITGNGKPLWSERSTKFHATGVRFVGPSQNNTVKNNTISLWSKAGIGYGGTNQRTTVIDGNESFDNGNGITNTEGGAQLTGCWYMWFTNNVIHDNVVQGIRPGGCSYVVLEGNSSYNNGATGIQVEINIYIVIVRNNILYNNSLAPQSGNETGAWIDSGGWALVEGNTVYGNLRGIVCTDWHRCIVRNNISYENSNVSSGTTYRNAFFTHNTSVQGYSCVADPPGTPYTPGTPCGLYHFIYNNTSDNDGARPPEHTNPTATAAYVAPQVDASTWADELSASTYFKNNVIYDTRALYDIRTYNPNYGQCFENNYFYHPTRNFLGYDSSGSFNGATFEDATVWNPACDATTNYARDGDSTDPLFTNVTTHDYSLQAGSPLIDKAGALTSITNVSGSDLTVGEAGYFFDGWGIPSAPVSSQNVEGDLIAIFSSTWTLRGTARVLQANYVTNVLTVDSVPSGTVTGDLIVVATDYNGAILTDRPEIGAIWKMGTPPAAPTINQLHGCFKSWQGPETEPCISNEDIQGASRLEGKIIAWMGTEVVDSNPAPGTVKGQYSLNDGAWTDLADSCTSPCVHYVAAPQIANHLLTTERLINPHSPQYTQGYVITSVLGTPPTIDAVQNDWLEFGLSVQFQGLSLNDKVEFRVVDSDGTPFDSYASDGSGNTIPNLTIGAGFASVF